MIYCFVFKSFCIFFPSMAGVFCFHCENTLIEGISIKLSKQGLSNQFHGILDMGGIHFEAFGIEHIFCKLFVALFIQVPIVLPLRSDLLDHLGNGGES